MEEEKFIKMFGSDTQGGSIIKVIGVGGGGGNAVNYMHKQGVHGVSFVVCNTDVQDLQKSPIEYKIQLGKQLTEGTGAGSEPEQGRQAAQESIGDITAMLNPVNTKMVFIVAGMGGGTGTGAAPVIAKRAKEAGILTVAVVTIPYEYEGKRSKVALAGIEALKPCVDAILIIKNDNIRKLYGKLRVSAAANKANELLCTAVRGIAEIITKTGVRNVDFADVKNVMKNSGLAIMGTGRSNGEKRANDATEQAVNSPLLDYKISNAKGLLVNIVEGTDEQYELFEEEIEEIITHITKKTGKEVDIKYGIARDESLGEDIAVTIIVTGIEVEKEDKPSDAKPKAPGIKIVPAAPEVEDDLLAPPLPDDEDDDDGFLKPYTPKGRGRAPIISDEPAIYQGKNRMVRASKPSNYALGSDGKVGRGNAAFLTDNPD
jgi:cell division protein FtsZ